MGLKVTTLTSKSTFFMSEGRFIKTIEAVTDLLTETEVDGVCLLGFAIVYLEDGSIKVIQKVRKDLTGEAKEREALSMAPTPPKGPRPPRHTGRKSFRAKKHKGRSRSADVSTRPPFRL